MDLKNYIMDKKEYSLGLIPMFEESSIMSFLDKTHIDYDYDSIHSQRILTINTKLLKEETVRKVHKFLTETYGCKEGCVKEVDGNGLKETPTDEKLKETLEEEIEDKTTNVGDVQTTVESVELTETQKKLKIALLKEKIEKKTGKKVLFKEEVLDEDLMALNPDNLTALQQGVVMAGTLGLLVAGAFGRFVKDWALETFGSNPDKAASNPKMAMQAIQQAPPQIKQAINKAVDQVQAQNVQQEGLKEANYQGPESYRSAMRLKDIITKAGGDNNKALQLAQQMANKTGSDKLQQRAKAAELELKSKLSGDNLIYFEMYKIFSDAAKGKGAMGLNENAPDKD